MNPQNLVWLRIQAVVSPLLSGCCAMGWAAILICGNVSAQTNTTPSQPAADKAEFAEHAQKVYQAAKTRLATQTNNPEAQWQFGRACFDWADFATSNSSRAAIAGEGIAACNSVIAQNAASVPGHYYLTMNLGELAQTKKLGALKLVTQMETEFKTVLGLDPQFDHAGADRGLGLLYLETPGWPTSIGNKTKARQHLQKAVSLAPDFPENVLNLIEAELKWGEKSSALRDLKTLDDLWPAARAKFTGEDWASSWADWEARRAAARKKAPAKT